MKRALRFYLSAAVLVSVGFGSVGTAEAVTSTTKVHVAAPRTLFNKHITLSVQALVARILKEECQFFPVLCAFVSPLPTTVPSVTVSTTTTVVPPPTTVTSVPTTVTTIVPITVITLPVIAVPVPLAVPSSSGSTCTVTMIGGGVSQCIQTASASSSG